MRSLVVAACAALLGTAASAQMIGEELAAVLERADCTLSEEELAERFMADGWSVGDYQAQATALMRGRHLVAGEAEGELRLVNWGSCS